MACGFYKIWRESEELEPLGVVTLFHCEVTHMFIVSATTPTYTGTRQTTHRYNQLYQILSCKSEFCLETIREFFRNRYRESHNYCNYTH